MDDGFYILRFEDGVFLYERKNTQWFYWSTLYKSWIECFKWSDEDALGMLPVI